MKVSIVGASGYGGGELLRLLLQHPQIESSSVHFGKICRQAGQPSASQSSKADDAEILQPAGFRKSGFVAYRPAPFPLHAEI
jgi:N-acetyl-gamma-glutamylphosphate reductase